MQCSWLAWSSRRSRIHRRPGCRLVRSIGPDTDTAATTAPPTTTGALTDATPFSRGINSFQLLKDGDRYWVVNIFWDSERPGNPIPYQYLPQIKAVPR